MASRSQLSGRGTLNGVLDKVRGPGPRANVSEGGLVTTIPTEKQQSPAIQGRIKQAVSGVGGKPGGLSQLVPNVGGAVTDNPVTKPTLNRSRSRPIRYPQDR